MEEKVGHYSSGMVSRLGFAIATAGDTPEILILDEVLSVGDLFFRKKSEARIREMIHGGSTVLMVSHSPGVIRENCTQALWLDRGKLRLFGSPKAVCDAFEASQQPGKGASMKRALYHFLTTRRPQAGQRYQALRQRGVPPLEGRPRPAGRGLCPGREYPPCQPRAASPPKPSGKTPGFWPTGWHSSTWFPSTCLTPCCFGRWTTHRRLFPWWAPSSPTRISAGCG